MKIQKIWDISGITPYINVFWTLLKWDFDQNPPPKIFEPLDVNRWVYGDHGDYNQS